MQYFHRRCTEQVVVPEIPAQMNDIRVIERVHLSVFHGESKDKVAARVEARFHIVRVYRVQPAGESGGIADYRGESISGKFPLARHFFKELLAAHVWIGLLQQEAHIRLGVRLHGASAVADMFGYRLAHSNSRGAYTAPYGIAGKYLPVPDVHAVSALCHKLKARLLVLFSVEKSVEYVHIIA